MAIVKKEIDYAKELGDCMVLVVELVKDIKAKKSLSEIAGENLANLIAAIDGIDGASAEMKDHKEAAIATLGFHVGELAGALMAPAPEAPEAPAAA